MSTKNYKTGFMLGLFWGGVGGCRGLFWTGILGERRGGGVRSEVWAPRVIKLGLCKEALILYWDIRVCAPNIIKLVSCWGGVGGCGELFWTGILGGRRGGGVLKLRCEHQKL